MCASLEKKAHIELWYDCLASRILSNIIDVWRSPFFMFENKRLMFHQQLIYLTFRIVNISDNSRA